MSRSHLADLLSHRDVKEGFFVNLQRLIEIEKIGITKKRGKVNEFDKSGAALNFNHLADLLSLKDVEKGLS